MFCTFFCPKRKYPIFKQLQTCDIEQNKTFIPNFLVTVENLRVVRHAITCFLHLFVPKEEVSGFHNGQSSYFQKLRRVFEVKNHQKSMLRGTLLVKQALITHLIRLISSLSKNPRIKTCAMQKRSPVPNFTPISPIPEGSCRSKTVSRFHEFHPPYLVLYVVWQKYARAL